MTHEAIMRGLSKFERVILQYPALQELVAAHRNNKELTEVRAENMAKGTRLLKTLSQEISTKSAQITRLDPSVCKQRVKANYKNTCQLFPWTPRRKLLMMHY